MGIYMGSILPPWAHFRRELSGEAPRFRSKVCRLAKHSWVDKTGKRWLIAEMELRHLVNVIALLTRKGNTDLPCFRPMVEEFNKRINADFGRTDDE